MVAQFARLISILQGWRSQSHIYNCVAVTRFEDLTVSKMLSISRFMLIIIIANTFTGRRHYWTYFSSLDVKHVTRVTLLRIACGAA